MCYAIPAKIIEIKDDNAKVDYGGIMKTVNVTLVDGAEQGDYVLIHAGFAIEKLNKKSAEEALEVIKREKARLAEMDADKTDNGGLDLDGDDDY